MKKLFSREVKIGLSVIIAIVVLIYGINFLKGVNIFKASNYYYVTYPNVAGLETSANVILNGFKVGQVRSIDYDYEHPGNVNVELSLNKDLKLPEGTSAALTTDMLGTGSVTLHLGSGTQFMPVGSKLAGKVEPGLVEALTTKFGPSISHILPQIDTLLININAIVGNPAIMTSVQRLDAITANLQSTTESLTKMAQQLAPLPGQIAPILTDVKGITGNVNTITSDVAVLSGHLREVPVDSLIASLQTTTDNLRQLSEQLSDPNSSLGLLLNDPALYNNLNSTVLSLDSLLIDVKKNPKRYISIKLL